MKKIIIISAIAAIFLGAMGGGFYVILGKIAAIEKSFNPAATEEGAANAAVEEGPKPIFSLATMIVNLSDKGGRRYLRATMDIELNQSGDEQKMEDKLPQIKDAGIKIMSTRGFEDINSIAGKNLLRDEIIAKFNEIMKSEVINNIYFTEFVVQ